MIRHIGVFVGGLALLGFLPILLLLYMKQPELFGEVLTSMLLCWVFGWILIAVSLERVK